MSAPNIDRYIRKGVIDIPADDWYMLNCNYTKDELTIAISQNILSGKITLPVRNLTCNDAKESFEKLCAYKCNDFFYGETFTRYEYSYKLENKYLNESTIGNISSDYFQQENRYKCDSINSPSPYRVWTNEKFCKSMLGALWTLKCQKVDTNTLRSLLSLRKYIASQYKPTIAKSIYEKFDSVNILDFSAGWGDRLAGFYATDNTKSYIGIDPNTAVYNKYFTQKSCYDKLTTPKELVCFVNKPAEEVSLGEEIVDTVFTSPPYYNIERYSRELTQSVWRYRKLNDWLNKFLFKAIDNSWNALKRGGNMLINISDVYSNHTINHIVDPMCAHIEEIGGKFVEGFGMAMSKRPNSGALKGKTGQFVEPIWHFVKP